MKPELIIFPFYAFVASSSTFALAIDTTSTMNQNIFGHRWNQEVSDDFDRLNQLLETVSINIDDDMTVSEKVGLINLNLVIDSLICRDISIGNVAINHRAGVGDSAATNQIDVGIALNGIDAACDIEYQYAYGFLKGTAKAEVVTDGNAADVSIEFETNNRNGDFIVTSSVANCVVDVEISDVNFIDADFATNVVGLFEKYLRDLIEKEIEGFACSQFSSTGVSFLNDELFTMINEALMDLTISEDSGAVAGETSIESNYDATQAVNFQEIADTQIGNLIEMALNQLDQLFGSENNDNSDELGINNLLRSYILDENGAFVLNIAELLGNDGSTFEVHNELTNTLIALEEVRIYGLDSMTKFDPLMIVGDYTLRNEFSWKSLNVEIDALLDIRTSSLEEAVLKQDSDSEQKGIVEQIKVQIGAENVDVVASLFALIDVEALGSFTIGSVLSLATTDDYAWVLPCLMSAIQELRFVELEISPQQIKIPIFEGFIDDGLDRILSNVAETAFEMYEDFLVQDILPMMVQNTVTKFANDLIAKTLEDSSNNSNSCPKYDEVTAGDAEYYVDFREFFDSSVNSEYGELPSMLWDLMDMELLEENPTTGMPKINEVLIDALTKGQSGTEGTLLFGGDGEDIFNIVQRIIVGGFDANVRVSASDIRIENLDTVVAPLILLEPVPTEPYFLNNSATVGVEDRPMKLAATFAFAIIDNVEGVEISNNIDISFDMHTASVLATLMLKISKSKLLGFPLIDVFDLNCWMATIPAPTLNEQGVSVGDDEVYATIVDFAASVPNLNLNVSCVDCSSPGIIELSELLTSSGEAQDDVALLANTLLLSASDMIKGDLLQVQIDRLLNDASKQCRHSPNYDPNFSRNQQDYNEFEAVEIEGSTTYLVSVGVASVVLVLMVALLVFSIRFFTRRRHSRWMSTLPMEQVEALNHIQHNNVALESALNATTYSMFQSIEDIPCILRWGMPFIILGNIALFISGHLNLGATVNIEATVAGETIKIDEFFEFSMAKSTIDIWNAGGKELAILILVFSGIWPYTKQLITLVLWFTPTSWVPISRRGLMLVWLDWMAKWSMIDIFVLIICLAAFRVSVNSPSNLAFLPEGFYSLDLLVVPMWGLYANLIAQLVSQVSSHFVIHYHRKVAKRALDSYSKSIANHSSKTREDQKELLRTHQFGRPHRGEEEKLIVRTWVNYTLISMVSSSAAFIIAGCIFPSFSIEVFGLLGVAVESGQESREAKTYHSVFTVIKLLFEQAKFLEIVKNYVGLGSFSVIFALTVLLVPIFQSLVLLGHWFVPMTMKQRLKMSVVVEILQAWQYAEVYVIAIFVASWQLGPISSFMVNSYCDSLDGFFSELVFYGILKNEDAQCFAVESSIEAGFFILAVGAILLTLMNAIVTKATKQYCRDLDELKKRQTQIQEHTTSRMEYAEEGQEINTNHSESTIHPPPVSFTDTFRWLLKQDGKSKKSCDQPSIENSSIQESRTQDS